MKLKKILAAALSAAMVLSCMTVSGGNVVQAAGEDLGVNVARDLDIVAYSGDSGTHPISKVKDGVKNNENDENRWESAEPLKGNGNQNNASYIIFDLGDSKIDATSVRSYSKIKIKFHNMAYATKYKVLTSDTCNIETNQKLPKGVIPQGWDKIDERDHKVVLNAFPENELVARTDNVKRYLMFFFTDMYAQAGLNTVSIREIEIYNKRVSDVGLSETSTTLNVGDSKTLTATTSPTDATQQGFNWSSSNSEIASVDENGNVTAVTPGEATITVSSKDSEQIKETCLVTVTAPVDKTELNELIAKAGELVEENYTPESWTPFKAALDAAIVIRDKSDASEDEVTNAINTLEGTMNKLVRLYKVTVNGVVKASGIYNTLVTLTADPAQPGEKFAGWVLDGKTVSLDENYKIAIVGDMNFTTKYVSTSVNIEKDSYAKIVNTEIIKRDDKKANVRFMAQLSIPEGYTLNETGLMWTVKDEVQNLHTEANEPATGARKTISPKVNTAYQFTVKLNGLSEGGTIRGEVYAKITNNETGESKWIYSDVVAVTNN